MKKKYMGITALLLAVFLLVGCGIDIDTERFTEDDYQSTNFAGGDNYTKTSSVYNQKKLGATLKCKLFDGYETMWTVSCRSDSKEVILVSMSIEGGIGKLINVDENGLVTTIAEVTPGAPIENAQYAIAMSEGDNKIKFVGNDVENLVLEFEFPENGGSGF